MKKKLLARTTNRYCCFLFLSIFILTNIAITQQIHATPLSPKLININSRHILSSIRDSSFADEKILQNHIDTADTSKEKQKLQHPEPSEKTVQPLSKFEQFISGKSLPVISMDIKQFGYDLFMNPPSTFAPTTNVPVGPEYVLGTGDEIRITVWGKVEGKWNVMVDRDGNISLPKVGIIGVTGLNFSELNKFLYKEFSKYYTGFEMNVSMGALKTIRVYLVGNSSRPGAYTISSLSTLVNALFEAGGPSKTGTMRDIQLKRNGQTIEHFDMYDFLLKGDKTKDTRLMPDDVIFIPSVGPLVGIAGNVKRPAIYELKKETKLQELIDMANGLTSFAFKGRFQVKRVQDNQFRTMIEGDLIDFESNPDKNITLTDGDLVKVFAIIDSKNTIKLTGSVVNEGEYAIMPGVTKISDVISKAGGVLYYASEKAELTRVTITQEGPRSELIHIDLSKAVAGDPEHDIALEINDYIFVRTIPEWKLYETVSITGEVKYPGTYTIKKGDNLSSIIERVGGYTDKAYLRGAFFTRNSVRKQQQQSLIEMIQRLEKELITEGSVQVSISSSSEELEAKKAVFEQKKQFIESLRQLKATGRMSVHLAHIRLLKNSKYDIALEQGDSLYIPMINSVVNVVGAVMSRGSFIYADNLNYNDYVGMTGGYSRYADEDRVYVLKVDGTARKLSNGFFSWNTSKATWEMEGFVEEIKEIEPGDTIVVPEKLEQIAWMREIKDITQILYQIAVTAGVLIVAF